MADIVACITEPAKTVGKWIGQQIFNQLTFLWCFTANITSLKEEFQKLNDDTEELEGEVETARDNRSQKPVPRVKTWLTNSNNLKGEINGILNEAENVGSGVSKLGARFILSKRAKETTERTEKLRGEKPKVEFQPGPIAARQEVQLEKTFECESRNKIEEDIMNTLEDVKKKMIGICGMGGLGKTTMATKILNRALHESVFREAVIVTVSQDVNISKIQEHLGDKLGLNTLKGENQNQTNRANLLQSRLRDTKRTLLVLDDVWDTDTTLLESIGIPRDSEWCTILFTSRNRDVLHAMRVETIFEIEMLSEEEAWSFFRERAGTCVDDRELKPIAKQVAKECGKLPLALDVVGVGLRDQHDAGTWENALLELQQRVPDTVQFDNKKVYNPLKLSYKGLDSEAAKSIFLLCCLFPEDEDIPREYLINFCMGLGVFERITNRRAARYKTCALTQKLKDRSLLLESDKEDCVRMHDVVHDVCILIAEEEGCIGKDGGRWISLSHLVGETKELLSCPTLRLLFFDGIYNSSGFKFDDASLQGMIGLRVLCIQHCSSLTRLPHPTQSLGNLSTLILVACAELETISVVGELVNLEILICRHCELIEELPSEMKRLNCLKLLELTGCSKLQSIGRGIISSLVGLEELKMLGSFDGWEAEESEERENASIKELGALPNLACLQILICRKNLNEHKRDFVWENDEDSEAIELAFSNKKIEARKNWLQNFVVRSWMNFVLFSIVKFSVVSSSAFQTLICQ